jgi:hypothetical protein
MIDTQNKIPIYSIFILLLILSGGYIIQLVPCKLQKVLNDNIYIKHLFCFLTLVFLVNLTDPEQNTKSLNIIIFKSFMLYIFFIFIIKTYYKFFILIMITLGIVYLIVIKKTEIDNELNNNKDINKEIELNNYKSKLIIVQNILFGFIIIFIILGFLIYLGEKKHQYKNKFNYFTFFLGKPDCSNIPDKINMLNSFKYAFTAR